MIYNYLERAVVIGKDKVRFFTSRDSFKKELEFMRNDGWNIELNESNDILEATIQFENDRQMLQFSRKLRVHKLFRAKPVMFLRTVRDQYLREAAEV